AAELEEDEGAEEAPPPALFFWSVDIEPEAEPEAEPEGLGAGAALDEEDAEPEGALVAPDGVEVEPAEELEPDAGGVVLVVSRVTVSLSPQAARPKARATAAANVVSFIAFLRGWG
ncbi:MAG TPA: hypothetical protein VFC18_17860, partial [Burkholderiales bacterium]|nr:hypothetical protein [Burkholderiales bacterium]